ncbi:E3 SUMO-protein ligase ZNF451 isoform 1-T3 [Syngnathus typhle]
MSSPNTQDDEDDVEFVSEGQLSPVECVDLSDSDDERSSSSSSMEKEKQRQPDHAVSGSSTKEANLEAKRQVALWLKLSDVQTENVYSGSKRRRRAAHPTKPSTKYLCPVINCCRVYDNALLLGGHLKRFDHSPCDPTITLKESSTKVFACVACCRHFQTQEEWQAHLEFKVSSSHPEGHSMSQRCMSITCYACPTCYLFFNKREDCFQHMSEKKHFTESLKMSDSQREVVPVPFPHRAMNRLIALCRDTPFTVQCTFCHKVLTSHQEITAHFNVKCINGTAVAKADATVVQLVKQLRVRGQCSRCCSMFLSQTEVERHKEDTRHEVEINGTMEQALLQFDKFHEKQVIYWFKYEENPTSGILIHKSVTTKNECEQVPTKRNKLGSSTAWFCECGMKFLDETSASNHLLAVNQIFYQCGVCDKRMGESCMARLHMCRIHGGAHLENFFIYCCKCKVKIPRPADVLPHVSDAHTGHTFCTERDVPEDAQPSTSNSDKMDLCTISESIPEVAAASSSRALPTWMCRMCEDVFDSEAAVRKHCGDLSSHKFQKFVCGHCPQKFFKASTVKRHCANEHDGQMKSAYFCGLCNSKQFESEGDFLRHYESLHSNDFYCIGNDDIVQPAGSSTPLEPCPCMNSEKSRDGLNVIYTRCMKTLASEGLCQYMCAPCALRVHSYVQIKTHVNTIHPALNLDETFEVECQTCSQCFGDVPEFHDHYHSQHCGLAPCVSSRACRKDATKPPPTLKNVEVKEQLNDASDVKVKHKRALSAEDQESVELQEALQRSLLDF